MQPPDSWPQRFMAALVPSGRVMALILPLAGFAVVVAAGLMLAADRELGAISRDITRQAHEVQVPQRSGPTMSQRLDAIDQRLQAIELRLSP